MRSAAIGVDKQHATSLQTLRKRTRRFEYFFDDMTGRTESSSKLADPVVIGIVTTPHGVRGTLRVKPVGSGHHLREDIAPLVGDKRRRILKSRQTPKGFLVDLEGIEGRQEANSMRGAELFLDRSELDEPEGDEFYVADLVGLEAFDEAGEKIGTVRETFETAAHEVLVIATGDEETYVPFTTTHVPEVEIEAGRVIVAPPEE